MKLISAMVFLFVLSACGGDTVSDPAPTEQNTSFNLQCDLTALYTATADPIVSSGSGTATTTVIALHGKSGAPTRAHMQTLAADLNQQDYKVVMPYMPWSELDWNGTLCDSISYINNLVTNELNSGNSVILLGHSMAGPIILAYGALPDTAKPGALAVVAPGHYVPNSSVLAGLHAASIELAKNMISNGQGDQNATFQTSDYNISTTPVIYLSFHASEQLSDQLPDIKASIPRVSIPVLWLAGTGDRLTEITKTLGIIDALPADSNYTYREIAGDHYSLIDNVTSEMGPWFQGL